MTYFELFAITTLGLLLLAGLAWLADRWADRELAQQPRPDRRLPADERRLLGDDWRECVKGFFTERFIRSTRTRFAVAATCGADPHKTGPDAGKRTEALTGKEMSHARSSK